MPHFFAFRLDYEKCCCLLLLAAVIVDKMLIGIGRLLTRPNRLDWQGMRVRVGGARSALRYLGVSNGNIFHMIYSILVWCIFSDKCFLLVWIGKRGWGLGGAMFENLQSHRWNIRRPKFSLCHEIWWTLNPTFKWEKILHQDTIYPQLMSLRRKLWSNAIAESDLNLTHTYLRISWNNHLMKTQLQFVEKKKVFCAQLKLKYVFPWVSMDR